MDLIDSGTLVHPFLTIRTYGNPITLPAKIGNGTLLDGAGQYIAVANQSEPCIASISRCYQHGLTVSMWTKFRRLHNGMFYLSTGNGIKVSRELACLSFVGENKDLNKILLHTRRPMTRPKWNRCLILP